MGKAYAFTDLHGQYDLWKQIRDYCQPDDTLYFLGDACDRGPEGIKIIKELLTDPRVTYLKGNHEEMLEVTAAEMLEGDMSGVQLWAVNGGMDTWTELMCEPDGIVKEILAKLKKLPLTATYTSPQGKTFYMSHSGSYSPIEYTYRGKWIKVDPDADCLWDRSHLDIQTWSDGYPDDYIIHGHSPVQNFFKSQVPTVYCEGHKIDLDVASFVTKKIYLYDLDEMTIAAEFKSE